MKHLALGAVIALALFAATTLVADVITAPPLSGNFALTISGFELVTASSTQLHLDIKGEGLVTADGSGNLTGSETFTAANPALPESGTVAAQCAGTLAGVVAEPGDGTAQIKLGFTPSTPDPTGVGAQDSCVPTALVLNCVEIFSQSFFPLLAGPVGPLGPTGPGTGQGPVCSPAPPPPLKPHHHHHHRGPKGEAAIAEGAAGAPVAWPFFFSSGAQKLKCVAASVTSSSTAASIDGASLSLDLQQTPPASIVVPTPAPQPSPNWTPEPPPPTVWPTPSAYGTPGAGVLMNR